MVTCWELNRNQPTAKFAKAIIAFLDYLPFLGSDHSLGRQLYFARLVTGKTQKQVADLIGCDESNLRLIERDERKPQPKTRQKIHNFINGALTF